MSTARQWLRSLLPDALRHFEQAASLSLADYAAGLTAPAGLPRPPQDGNDLLDLAVDACRQLYAPSVALALRRELEENFHALTANHHGVDFHPEFFQGNLLFAMSCRHAVPLFSCGVVPGNNVAYPRGMLLGKGSCRQSAAQFVRLPLLPGRYRHTLVSVQPPFTADTVRAALAALSRQLDPATHAALSRLVQRTYLQPAVLHQRSFRQQASVANSLLWQEVLHRDCHIPPLVALDMQYLCGRLIMADLRQPHTLVSRLLLQPELAAAVWQELNGQRACWSAEAQQLRRGTFLFWGVDAGGRALALAPAEDFRELVATGNPAWRLALAPEAIAAALQEQRLLPSLFLYFVTVAAARGLRCAGGIFQTSYLPRMLGGLVTSLRRCGETSLAHRLAAAFAPCPACTGLLPLRLPCPDAPEEPDDTMGRGAGAADVWLAGGLSARLWETMRRTRVEQALAVSLPYHYADLAGSEARPELYAELRQAARSAGPLPVLAATETETAHA
ncbi:hypothetical protein [uncultured Desulfovibrio sp.]|uniref:hypothetical protein n=1 Tax=uncultured Desulfovibrio sp. TaxID=167968 RepID=UPI002619341B|nr:hypothetical protein [uncultured Desulfovibrio sp.]